jgi:hypothetical protein
MFQEGVGTSHTHFTENYSTFLYNNCGIYNRIIQYCDFHNNLMSYVFMWGLGYQFHFIILNSIFSIHW